MLKMNRNEKSTKLSLEIRTPQRLNLKTASPTDTSITHLYAGKGEARNAATTNGNTKITIADNSIVRDSIVIQGNGNTTVTSDDQGVITINSADTSVASITDSEIDALFT